MKKQHFSGFLPAIYEYGWKLAMFPNCTWMDLYIKFSINLKLINIFAIIILYFIKIYKGNWLPSSMRKERNSFYHTEGEKLASGTQLIRVIRFKKISIYAHTLLKAHNERRVYESVDDNIEPITSYISKIDVKNN